MKTHAPEPEPEPTRRVEPRSRQELVDALVACNCGLRLDDLGLVRVIDPATRVEKFIPTRNWPLPPQAGEPPGGGHAAREPAESIAYKRRLGLRGRPPAEPGTAGKMPEHERRFWRGLGRRRGAAL